MKSSIFLPKTIRVGYQERKDTYTGKLAYVIYIDNKGKVRKEASWKSWTDAKITPNDYSNDPTDGFVLNKKVGGASESYGWNPRNTYARVYDPRGFEFEITVPNLLYLLENTSCIKGKGIEGKCVYGWDGADLLLLPEEAPDYKQLMDYRNNLYDKEKITIKNIVLGGTCLTDKNEQGIYLGRFEELETRTWRIKKRGELVGKRHWFKMADGTIRTFPGLSKFIKTISDTPVSDYADLMDEMERDPRYSPYDSNKDEYVPMTEEDIIIGGRWGKFYFDHEGIKVKARLDYMAEREHNGVVYPATIDVSSVERYSKVPDGQILETGLETTFSTDKNLLEDVGWADDHRGYSYSHRGYNRLYKYDPQLVSAKLKLQKLDILGNGYTPAKGGLSLETFIQEFQPQRIQKYLRNGKPYKNND